MNKRKTLRCAALSGPSRKMVLPGMKRFCLAADSHRGLVRPNNEDSYVYAFDSTGEYLLAGLADGIGGSRNGEVASVSAAKMLYMKWRDFAVPEKEPETEVMRFFLEAFQDINRRIYEVNSWGDQANPMGTTLAAAVFLRDSLVTAHAGDSRIYRTRNHEIFLLTCDHNLANDLIRSGKIEPDEASRVPGGKMLTQSIGPNEVLEPEISVFDLLPDDKYLLCSDGLMLHVNDMEILDTMENEPSPEEAIKALCRLTLHRGARDNTTMILARVQ